MAGIPITSLIDARKLRLMIPANLNVRSFPPRAIYLQMRNVGCPDTVRGNKWIKEKFTQTLLWLLDIFCSLDILTYGQSWIDDTLSTLTTEPVVF